MLLQKWRKLMHVLLEVDCWVFFVCFLKTKITILRGRTASHGSGSDRSSLSGHAPCGSSEAFHSEPFFPLPWGRCSHIKKFSNTPRSSPTLHSIRWANAEVRLLPEGFVLAHGAGKGRQTCMQVHHCGSGVCIPSYCCGAIVAVASRRHHYLSDAESPMWAPSPPLSSAQVFRLWSVVFQHIRSSVGRSAASAKQRKMPFEVPEGKSMWWIPLPLRCASCDDYPLILWPCWAQTSHTQINWLLYTYLCAVSQHPAAVAAATLICFPLLQLCCWKRWLEHLIWH